MIPSIGFYFKITLDTAESESDNGFQEVSGLAATLNEEAIQEGGNNHFKQLLPNRQKHANLVLKRGVIAADSGLASWCKKIVNFGLETPVTTKTLHLMLLDETGIPLKTWTFQEAFPVKWEIGELKSEENRLFIESLEFAYQSLND